MDRSLSLAYDRRLHPRAERSSTTWSAAVLVRPGRQARLLDISDSGALVEIDTPLRPGTHVQLQFTRRNHRIAVRGQVVRCHVASLGGGWGVQYHGAVAFDARLSSLSNPESEYPLPRMGSCATTLDGQ
jgi:PilZ domain-containing protein